MSATDEPTACGLFYHAARKHGVEKIREPVERFMRTAVATCGDPEDPERRDAMAVFIENVLGWLDGNVSFGQLAYTPGVGDIYTSDPKAVVLMSVLGFMCDRLSHYHKHPRCGIRHDPFGEVKQECSDVVDVGLAPLAEKLLEGLK